MRKLLLVLFLFSTATSYLSAQNNIDDADFDDRIKYSIFYGINASFIENYGSPGFQGERSGFNTGFIAEMPFANKWSFEGSVFFAVEGEQPIEDGRRVARFRMNTINIPVQFKYYVTDGFSLHFGPQISYIFEPKVFEDQNQDFRVVDNVVNTGFGGTAGFGFKFPGFGLFIKSTFSYGFTDIFINNDIYESERLKVIRFSLGYRF
jgi:hypothetical protein